MVRAVVWEVLGWRVAPRDSQPEGVSWEQVDSKQLTGGETGLESTVRPDIGLDRLQLSEMICGAKLGQV